MTHPNDPIHRPVQPPLTDLLAGYLRQQVSRHAAGLAGTDTAGEVVPYEAVPVQPVDAGLAWREALAIARHYQPESKTQTWLVPPDWGTVVASQEPAASIAFSFGNYPQLVRNLHALLHATDLPALLPKQTSSSSAILLRDWAAATQREQPFPQVLLTAGVLRLARQFDEAAELLQRHQASTPADWQAAWANEEAALAWHRGQVEQAASLWEKQTPSIPVLFNRGVSALFLGKPAAARPLLTQAVAELSEADGWHHLGRLYLALAEMRYR
jgi:tetratricopeptide (TPR) repeat protein